MNRLLMPLSALVGVGLVLAAGDVLLNGAGTSVALASGHAPAVAARQVDASAVGTAVRVSDASLVVNTDGSTALGALVHNDQESDVSLMGVVISIDRHSVAVNATEFWLPVLAGEQAYVGAASDAGGFVVPDGITAGTRADVEFHFDDGTCVLADVTAAARSSRHRLVHPTSGRPIGSVTTDDPPAGTTSCVGPPASETAAADPKTHELGVTIRDEPALDAYQARSQGKCRAIVWGDDSEQLGELVVSSPEDGGDLATLKMFEIPATARLLPDGTCEATMTITMPYAASYVLGVGITGRGIALDNAPLLPVTVTEGDSQSVTVVK